MTSLRTSLDDPDFPLHSQGPPRNGGRELAGYVGLIITIVSLIFTAGYNWRRITEVTESHAKLVDDVSLNYVRKDVNREQMLTITSQLEEIRMRVTTLQRDAGR